MANDPWLDDVVIPTTPCPPARCTLDEWLREAATLDHLNLRPLEEQAPDDAKLHWLTRGTHKTAGREIVLELARDGWSFDEIAERFDCPVEEVAKPLARGESDIPRIIAVERCWREHPDWPLRRIARYTDTTKTVVQHLVVRNLGGVPPLTQAIRDGGGTTYDSGVYDAIKALVGRGLSNSQIAGRLSMTRSAVEQIVRRQGWRKPQEVTA